MGPPRKAQKLDKHMHIEVARQMRWVQMKNPLPGVRFAPDQDGSFDFQGAQPFPVSPPPPATAKWDENAGLVPMEIYNADDMDPLDTLLRAMAASDNEVQITDPPAPPTEKNVQFHSNLSENTLAPENQHDAQGESPPQNALPPPSTSDEVLPENEENAVPMEISDDHNTDEPLDNPSEAVLPPGNEEKSDDLPRRSSRTRTQAQYYQSDEVERQDKNARGNNQWLHRLLAFNT